MNIISEEKSLKKFKKRLNQCNIDLNKLIRNSSKKIIFGNEIAIINYLLCYTIEYNNSSDIFKYIIEICYFREFDDLEKFNCLLFAVFRNRMDKADILLQNNIKLRYYYFDSFDSLDNNRQIEYIYNKGIKDVNNIQDVLDSWSCSKRVKKNNKFDDQLFKTLFNCYDRLIKFNNNKKFIDVHKIKISDDYYKKAIKIESYSIIKILFSYDSCEKEEMIYKIKDLKLLYYVIYFGFRKKDILIEDLLSFIERTFEIPINIYDKEFNKYILRCLDIKNLTPLENAIKHDNPPVIMVLINNGAEINHINEKSKNSILMNAIENNNTECIDFLLQQKIDINYVNPINQKNALIVAIEKKNYEIFKPLIKNGADVNYIQQDTDKSVLMYALDSGDYRIINYLISCGANVNYIQENNKKSILEYAIELSSEKYNNKQASNQTILRQEFSISHNKYINQLKIFELLVSNGADINYENKKTKKTMLIKVIGFQNKEFLSNFLKFNVDINKKNSENKSAIGIVLDECVKLKKYINEISKNNGPWYEPRFPYRLSNFNYTNSTQKQNRETYNHFVKMYKIKKDIFEILIKSNAKNQNSSELYMDESIPRIIISNGRLDLLKILVENNFDINTKDDYGDTILNYAINSEDKDIAEYILSFPNLKVNNTKDSDSKELLNLIIKRTDEDYF
ncbi:ankyrin [Neocallimastix californiae]|uniref:Ankyrin n=1 Tax=Neocallimastix californiae TaxID=1754190 RepID=A0A1Y2AN54_9FUNG|nr:ankyrin [Neocallimastix californiae]|eukprot:ORY23647.1 ankyrin [Neocallimastix californiae]